ncbi:GntR family transcriptional regulator [Klugiella xanthotipulae]|uniref:GntR family transcriptional regulator n=1 Tax=Klugiella xanthotipulae TaxID=244735 RepID=A0A543I3T9_9MICO|nr:GntR family transcriptional regulator [Klugiella xanthotipulae]TQM65266.1 GntR family transcriptional regulator [Klugiella xanthotipulae]
MLITIDETNDSPLFEQIAAAVRTGIVTGTIRRGDRMPTAKDLCASLAVNRNTVLHAYQMLRDEGLVELRRGRGATVTAQADNLVQLSVAVNNLVTEARELGISPEILSRLVKESSA